MKYILELHYSVRNGGDGSAYPHLMSSKELAQYDQDNMNEGWGESCLGSFTVESDSPIFIKDEVKTPEGYLIDLLSNGDGDGADKFIEEFFPDGKPKFKVKTRPTGNEKYLYNDVFVDDKQVAKNIFRSIKDSGKAFEEFINE